VDGRILEEYETVSRYPMLSPVSAPAQYLFSYPMKSGNLLETLGGSCIKIRMGRSDGEGQAGDHCGKKRQ
jgi:hypothetical protein